MRHPVNLGQGAALQTGFEYVLGDPSTRYVVTYDADGQHQLQDVVVMVERARRGDVDVVFGSRFLDERTRPTRAKRPEPSAEYPADDRLRLPKRRSRRFCLIAFSPDLARSLPPRAKPLWESEERLANQRCCLVPIELTIC